MAMRMDAAKVVISSLQLLVLVLLCLSITTPAQPSWVPKVYNYTKITQAHEIMLIQGRPSGFRDNFIARSLLSYPNVAAAAAADDIQSLSILARDLTLEFRPTPKKPPFLQEWIEDRPFIEFRILSIGTLVGWYSYSASAASKGVPEKVKQIDSGRGVHKQQVLNVSAMLMASMNNPAGGQSPAMLLEGVYNPADGRMFLMGCRNVHDPRRVLTTISDDEHEDGNVMDCSIQVRVEYPPTKNQWMVVSRAAKVSVTSTRDDIDPLHFSRTELRTLPNYDYNLQGMRRPESTQGLYCIAMLSTIIAATIGQLRYLDSHGEVAPYVSLVMLGVQAVGYSWTLVTGARMVPAWHIYAYKTSLDGMDCSVNALTLAALLLTLWLAHKVWLSRRALARVPSPPSERVPRDGAVLLWSFAVHSCCLFFVVAVHWLSTPPPPLPPSREMTYVDGQMVPPNYLYRWWGHHIVGRYAGVAKEWFLLPQVIGNAVWRVNCKPLTGRYYTGVTVAWLLAHVYEFLWPAPYFYLQYTEANNDIMHYIHSKAAAVVVPVIGVMLALLVYVQQRWNYKTVGHRNKLLHHEY